MNAAGLQLFVNWVTNADKLSPSLLEQVYIALTGHHQHGRVDAVTVVALLAGVHKKTARGWYQSLEACGWGLAFTAGVAAAGAAVGSSQEAVGSLEEAEDALPEVEVAAVVDAESGGEEDSPLCLDMVIPRSRWLGRGSRRGSRWLIPRSRWLGRGS